jgi:hypothetical protein
MTDSTAAATTHIPERENRYLTMRLPRGESKPPSQEAQQAILPAVADFAERLAGVIEGRP